MALSPTTELCSTWGDYVRRIPGTGFVFRGQSAALSHLTTTLDRCLEGIAVERRWKYEAALLRDFKRRACHYVEDPPASQEHLEWLALMRHYGAPSRLLDFSYSGFVAAFFALSDVRSANTPTAAAVWQVDLGWLKTAFQNVHPGPFIDFHEPAMFATHLLRPPPGESGSRRPCVAAVNPYRMNERLTIQQGLFLCPSDLTVSFEEGLEAMGTPVPITKYILEPSCHKEALRALRTMNISFASLFPDLEGFSRFLWHRVDDLFDKFSIDDSVLLKEVCYEKP